MPEPMTIEEIDAALEVCGKATPGPWGVFDSASNALGVGRDDEDEPFVAEVIEEMADKPTQANRDNFAFISAARTDYPRALAELKRMKTPVRRKEWDGLYFCGACAEVFIEDDIIHCPDCGIQIVCDHDKSFAEYCAPCGRVNEK